MFVTFILMITKAFSRKNVSRKLSQVGDIRSLTHHITHHKYFIPVHTFKKGYSAKCCRYQNCDTSGISHVFHMYSTCIGFQTMHVEVIVPNFRFCYNLAASSVPNCILITFVSTHTLHASLTLGSKHEWWSFWGRKCTASVAMCVWSSVYEGCTVWLQ